MITGGHRPGLSVVVGGLSEEEFLTRGGNDKETLTLGTLTDFCINASVFRI